MDLKGALLRLGFDSQAQPTVAQVHTAYDTQMQTVGQRDDATSNGLSTARVMVLDYAQSLAAKETAMCKRVDAMRVLPYETTKPMDLKGAMRELDLKDDAVLDEKEIHAVWEKQIRGTFPREPHTIERRLNRARDILLDWVQLPQYKEALRQAEALRAEQAEALRAEQALRVQQAEALLAEQAVALRVQQAEALRAEQALRAEKALRVQQADATQANVAEQATRLKKRPRSGAKEDAYLERESDRMIQLERNEAEHEANINLMRTESINDCLLRAKLLEGKRLVAKRSQKADRPKARRQHRQSLHSEGSKELTAEMMRVFSECFEEKHDGRVMASDLLKVFAKSTTFPDFSKGYFTRHGHELFAAQWPDKTFTTFKHNRCYVGIAVKHDE